MQTKFIYCLAMIIGCGSCSKMKSDIVYPDKDFPSQIPKIFASGEISLPNRYEQNITFSRDGKEYFYGSASAKDWWYESILSTKILDNGRVQTDTLPFIKNIPYKKDKIFIGEPFLSLDDKKLFFIVDYPPDIWVCEKQSNDVWAQPKVLPSPVNSNAGEWNPSLSANGTLYFASTRTDEGAVSTDGKIYKAELIEGNYPKIEMLKGEINKEDAGDPCISPNEEYLVFSSWRKGGYGGTDLYVSHRDENGEWTQPVNLGATINTPYEEVGPRISPDEKYLFFHRRDKWENATYSDIYWVDIAVLTTGKKSRK